MAIRRPTAGVIKQGFAGHFAWEPAGWMRKVGGILRGTRFSFAGAVKYLHLHCGIDYANAEGTKLYACHDGKIIAQSVDSYGGHFLYLQIRVGLIFKVTAVYWHLQAGSNQFKTGTKVKAGTFIARMGKTGKVTGPHLHFGLMRNRRGTSLSDLYRKATWLDPQPFIDGKNLTLVAP